MLRVKSTAQSGTDERLDDLHPDMDLLVKKLVVIEVDYFDIVSRKSDDNEIGCPPEMPVNS